MLTVKRHGPTAVAVVLAGHLIAGCLAGVRARDQREPRAYALLNGRWLASDRFEPRTMYVVGNIFRTAAPARIDSTIDLTGGYVVPPYAEAHNHWLEPKLAPAYNEKYLLDGVFYVADLGNAPFIHARLDSITNRPTGVDFRSAHQGWTGPGGHPLEIVGQLSAAGAFPPPATPEALDDFVFVVTTEAEIDQKWPKFLAGHPSMVKAFLISSDEYAKRRHDDRVGKNRGMDPALLPGLVRRAHQAGLPLAVHVATAADFHTAVAAGVDWIAHLPFFEETRGSKALPNASLISEEDAKLAAERHITVVPTIAWLHAEYTDSAKIARILRELLVPNLGLLKRNGVTMLVGSDQFRQTSVVEARVLAETGVFTNAELLRMWTQTTPRAIFPARKIGRLDDGFEASFLVLDGDPIQDFSATGKIRLRMKQGVWLTPSAARAQLPPLPGS